MTGPTMQDLRDAGVELRVQAIQRELDDLVRSWPWQLRLLARIARHMPHR